MGIAGQAGFSGIDARYFLVKCSRISAQGYSQEYTVEEARAELAELRYHLNRESRIKQVEFSRRYEHSYTIVAILPRHSVI